MLMRCLTVMQGGPEDDDSWMTGGAGDLEAELAQRQKEMEGDVAKRAKRTAQGLGSPKAAPEFDPSEMVSKLNVHSFGFLALARFTRSMSTTAMILYYL